MIDLFGVFEGLFVFFNQAEEVCVVVFGGDFGIVEPAQLFFDVNDLAAYGHLNGAGGKSARKVVFDVADGHFDGFIRFLVASEGHCNVLFDDGYFVLFQRIIECCGAFCGIDSVVFVNVFAKILLQVVCDFRIIRRVVLIQIIVEHGQFAVSFLYCRKVGFVAYLVEPDVVRVNDFACGRPARNQCDSISRIDVESLAVYAFAEDIAYQRNLVFVVQSVFEFDFSRAERSVVVLVYVVTVIFAGEDDIRFSSVRCNVVNGLLFVLGASVDDKFVRADYIFHLVGVTGDQNG